MPLSLQTREAAAASATWPDIYFTPGYALAEEARGAGKWFTITGESGAFLMPFLRRELTGGRWDAISPYGYTGVFARPELGTSTTNELAREAVQLLRDSGCVSYFCRESPVVPQISLPTQRFDVTRNHPVRIIPMADEETLWAGLKSEVRTRIRKARKHGMSAHVRTAGPHDFAPRSGFRSLYEATMDRLGAQSWYHFDTRYYEALLEGLGGRLRVVEVMDSQGTPAAAALLLVGDSTLHYHLAGSDPAAARLGANNLLMWTAMSHASAEGLEQYVLGGGLVGEDSLYKFKKGFGGGEAQFNAVGYIIDKKEYDLQIQRTASKHGITVEKIMETTFFPAYRSIS